MYNALFSPTFYIWYTKYINVENSNLRFCDGTQQKYLKSHFDSLPVEQQLEIIEKYDEFKNKFYINT